MTKNPKEGFRIILKLANLFLVGVAVVQLGRIWTADTRFARAARELQQDRLDRAVRFLQSAIDLNPGEPTYWRTQAALLASQGQPEAADLALEQALKLNPANLLTAKLAETVYEKLAREDSYYTTKWRQSIQRRRELCPTCPEDNLRPPSK